MRVVIGGDSVLKIYPFNRHEAHILEEMFLGLQGAKFGDEGMESDPVSPDGFRRFEIVEGKLRSIVGVDKADGESAPGADQ